jgi:hypothetical protein
MDKNVHSRPVFLDVQTSGLEPSKNFLTCIGTMDEKGAVIRYGPEEEILSLFSSYLGGMQLDQFFVTYNGENFDFPFLRERGGFPMENGHVDLFGIACERIGGERFIAKERACSKIGIYTPSIISGFRCAALANLDSERILPKDNLDIILHNAIDLYATAMLYYEFKRFGWI